MVHSRYQCATIIFITLQHINSAINLSGRSFKTQNRHSKFDPPQARKMWQFLFTTKATIYARFTVLFSFCFGARRRVIGRKGAFIIQLLLLFDQDHDSRNITTDISAFGSCSVPGCSMEMICDVEDERQRLGRLTIKNLFNNIFMQQLRGFEPWKQTANWIAV